MALKEKERKEKEKKRKEKKRKEEKTTLNKRAGIRSENELKCF